MDIVQEDEIAEIKATAATPEELSWIEFQLKEKQAALSRLENTAKYLSGLSSVTLTIILGPNNEIFRSLTHSITLKAGIISWLISILCTLVVLFPFRYRYANNSVDSIRRLHKKMAGLKFIFLLLGCLFYIAGICLVAFIFITNQASVTK